MVVNHPVFSDKGLIKMTELTINMLEKTIKQIKEQNWTSQLLIMSKENYDLFDYRIKTNTLKQIGNYVKCQGPDGKIWCERLIKMNYGYYTSLDIQVFIIRI